MHFKRGVLGVESQVDGPGFFLHPRGKHDPAAEWRADSAALRDGSARGDTAFSCRFPARAAWMRARLGIEATPGACPSYEAFRSRLAVDSVSLVFASSYINSPPSAFGHVYLKLRRANPHGTAGLSDYTVAFGARMQGGPLRVVWAGFTGGFHGSYNVTPFDASLRKYAYLDQREQWVFPLALDAVETERLVAHLWEMRQTHIDYYFLTENCAHHLASLLEAAAFGARLDGALVPTPVNLLRRARATGLAGEPRFLPSSRTDLGGRLHALEPAERRALEAVIGAGYEPGQAGALPDSSAARVLDAAARHMDYALGTSWITDSALHARRLETVARLVDLPAVPAPPARASESPARSHRAPRVEAGYRYGSGRDGALGLEVMPAFHSRTDAPDGVGNTLEFRLLALDLEAGLAEKDLRFERLVLLDLFNFTPSSPLLRGFAWRAAASLDHPANGPLGARFEAGAGRAMSASPENRQVAYGLFTGGARWGIGDSPSDAFAGLRAGLVLTPTARTRATLDLEGRAWARAGTSADAAFKVQYNFTVNAGISQSVEFRERDGHAPRAQTAFVGHF